MSWLHIQPCDGGLGIIVHGPSSLNFGRERGGREEGGREAPTGCGWRRRPRRGACARAASRCARLCARLFSICVPARSPRSMGGARRPRASCRQRTTFCASSSSSACRRHLLMRILALGWRLPTRVWRCSGGGVWDGRPAALRRAAGETACARRAVDLLHAGLQRGSCVLLRLLGYERRTRTCTCRMHPQGARGSLPCQR